MHNIDTSSVIDYCLKGNNILEASVGFSLSGTTLTITDNTTYGDSEARAALQISVFDGFGGKVEATMPAGGGGTLGVSTSSLNPSRDYSAIVTVVSDKGAIKDGSAYNIVALGDGDFDIEI